MKINEFIKQIEKITPLDYQENFDNTGLLIGEENTRINKILLTLDCTEEVVEEAIKENANFIISFHPVIFKGLKSITGKNYVEKTILKAIKNDIAIYSIHTALDNHINGVNKKISDKIELINTEILIPQKNTLKKITTYIPKKNAEELRNKLFEVGGGHISNYENCSFNFEGKGTFKGNENSNPVLGERGKIHTEEEICINLIFQKHLEHKLIKTLKENHPYEEIAYEIISLDNEYQNIGIGMIGELENEITEELFLENIKKIFNSKIIKHSKFSNRKIKKVAVLGGSGSFAIEKAISKKVDVFITSDLKYHDFFRAKNKILLADIGHYESEQFTLEILNSLIKEKFSNLAVCFSSLNTNPINYF